VALLVLLLLPGCTLIQRSSLPQTFNYAPKVSVEKVETQGIPIFVDEAKKIFIFKSVANGGATEIKSGRSLDCFKNSS